MSRRPHEPTDKSKAEVAALISYGVPIKQVAAYIGIDDKTLSKHYRAIMDEATAKAHAQVGKYLFQGASGALRKEGAAHSDCLRAAMFYAKTQMGWRENAPIGIDDESEIFPTEITIERRDARIAE